MLDGKAADGREIPMTMMSHLGGGRFQRSGWLLAVSQWAGLMAPPMSVHWHTVVFFRCDRKLYMCPVYTWWNSLERHSSDRVTTLHCSCMSPSRIK